MKPLARSLAALLLAASTAGACSMEMVDAPEMCRSEQAQLAEALAAYRKDHGRDLGELTLASLKTLQVQGYLSAVPEDPGFWNVDHVHHVRTPGGNGVGCLMHGVGAVDPSDLTPREQLELVGVTDAAVLARASNRSYQPVHGPSATEVALRDAGRDSLLALLPFSGAPLRVLQLLMMGH